MNRIHKENRPGFRATGWGRWVLVLLLAVVLGPARAQIVSFSFSATGVTTSGWVNVAGDPSMAVRTAAANGITVSSVSTLNWSPYSGSCAQNGKGFSPGTYLPSTVMANNWFNYNGSARSLALLNFHVPQIELTGLNPDSTYHVRISGSDTSSLLTNPTQYTLAGAITCGTRSLDVHNNSSSGVIFANVAPDAHGVIRIYVNATTNTDLAPICGIQVYPGSYQLASPMVTISTPANGQAVAEGDNVPIKATALETGGSISKVEFYADTMKIGEVDTVPQIFTWVNPDPGVYTITVMATDNSGTVGSANLAISVSSLNYFWSVTGNAGNNADGNFIGNVDSARLDFRTKGMQRMSIGATGNVGIGTISPTAGLHMTGSVRLAGLANDSAYQQSLVVDINGNLAYRSVSSLIPVVGGGLNESGSDTVVLGDPGAGPGNGNFLSNRYQSLNGNFYSIGGKADSPVNMPVFRWYNNGDLASGTTMDRSVNTQAKTGWRYYHKLGTVEIGASDRLDTLESKFGTGSWRGSGLAINSNDSIIARSPKMLNSIFVSGETLAMDTTFVMLNSLVAADSGLTEGTASITNTVVAGTGFFENSPVSNSVLTGTGVINASISGSFLGGSYTNQDVVGYSFAAGSVQGFGGLGQLLAGNALKNRTPYGSVFGDGNVDFSSLSYTGTQGVTAAGIAGYPLFVVGNSSTGRTISSNALTILFNGRAQINSTGYSTGLVQTAVTPKAALEVVSTNSGVLLPLLTTAQRNAIVTADLQTGLILYNTDTKNFQFYNGSAWNAVGAGGGLSNAWVSSGNTTTNPASNFIGTTDTERLVIRTDILERMTILSGGAVGIGTSSPQATALLAVRGTIYAKKIEATATGWPDYVFEPGYSLMSLPGLQRYIRQHRRLPGVVSASEALERGVDLGDNQATLLKKVEELTLYIIEMHRCSAERQKEIDRLTERSRKLDDHQHELTLLKKQLQKLVKD